MKFAHFILWVADPSVSRTFYRAVLDREPRLDVPGMTEFELTSGCVLGLMPESGAQRLLGLEGAPGATRCELYLVVDDPQEYIGRAAAAGALLVSPWQARDWGARVAYFLDPDRHVLAIADRVV